MRGTRSLMTKQGGEITAVWGVMTAFLVSICCIGPVMFAALGIRMGATGFLSGTAAFLRFLLPYRPIFIGLTIILVGISFYLAYRRSQPVCVSGSVSVPGAMTRANLTQLWVLAVLALGLIGAPYWLGL